ncbi:MAG: hypothetical protein ACKVOH_01830, partial [Chlamydiales bacterium]
KTPQFSYSRLKGANPVAHVEMASTGEVACLGSGFLEAFFASWTATEQRLEGKRVLVSIGGSDKVKLLPELKILDKLGYELYTTPGTHDFLSKHGIATRCLFKASAKRTPNVIDVIQERKVDFIINIPSSEVPSQTVTDGYQIRRLAIDHHIPLVTNLQIAASFLRCLIQPKEIEIKSWQSYVENKL